MKRFTPLGSTSLTGIVHRPITVIECTLEDQYA
jgi:hypothetical protein